MRRNWRTVVPLVFLFVGLLPAAVQALPNGPQAQVTGAGAAAAARIAASRLQVDAGELQAVSEAKVGDYSRVKVVHPKSGRIEVVDLDAAGREAPREKVEQLLAERRRADFVGKQEKELVEKVRGRPADERTTVVVWVRTPGPPPRDDRERATAESADAARQGFREHHVKATQGLREYAQGQRWKVEYQAENAPVLVVSVPNNQLRSLEARGEVDAIYLARVYRDELNVSVPAIDAPTVWGRGFTGSGVPIAVVEGGAIYFGHDNLADGTYCNTLASSPIAGHASGVAGIIASTHATNRGTAPGAPALLSGNAQSTSDAHIMACTDWAINNGARVINYSFGIDSSSALVGLDRYVDYVVRFRAVTMTKSSGNKSFTCTGPAFNVTSPGKGWNIITVGNYDDMGTAANGNDVMNTTDPGGSCFGDPASPHSDREKPEVAGPGTNITTTACTGPSTCSGGGTGTSFAAPHVAGCAALLMQRNSVLRSWPESVKAVLMASAVVNLEGSTRLSEHDGAGGIECDSADDVVSGAAGGEQHGTFVKTDFPKTYTFTATTGQTVRVVIAWDSNANAPSGGTAPTTDVLNADLDLVVTGPAGAWMGGSASWENSYEIVEFTAPSSGTYTAQVNAYRFDGSSEYLGVAWWRGTREK